MKSDYIGSTFLWLLSPLAGGLAPASYAALHWKFAGVPLSDSLGLFTVWAMRDIILSYLLTLPVLCLLRRFGLSGFAVMWLSATLVGAPMGLILANPLGFASTVTDEDIAHGPYWVEGVKYMLLFGLTGVAFRLTRALRVKLETQASVDMAA